MVPVFTKYRKESHSEEGAEDVEAALHHGRDELGDGGHAHQDDGHEGEYDIDALAQQDFGVHRVRLQGLLLLLVELQLRDASLAGLQGFLWARGKARIKCCWGNTGAGARTCTGPPCSGRCCWGSFTPTLMMIMVVMTDRCQTRIPGLALSCYSWIERACIYNREIP